ncbi:MAG TPA: pyridoxal-dependent decarboxylase [Pseudonocardia sp.]|nr:pyridoxal-dependent decarboxylase [Pseudonocardia sp.]
MSLARNLAADVFRPAPLQVDPELLRTELVAAAHWVADYLEALPGEPVTTPMPEQHRHRLAADTLSETGAPLASLRAFVQRDVAPYPCGNGHPRFFGWITSPPSPVGIVAELLATAINANCGAGEHALVDIERGVIATLARLAGMPAGTGGVLTSGGSMANLLCLAAARAWAVERFGLGGRDVDADHDAVHSRLTCYCSAQAHMCIGKAAKLIGLAPARLRRVPTAAGGGLDPGALSRMVRADLRAGLRPFCAVSTLGTTGTGAVDPIEAVAEVCRRHDMWHHADGAYGGLGALVAELAPHYTAMHRLDSLAVDGHKTLQVPIDCGGALATDPRRLRAAFAEHPSYLDTDPASDRPWLSELSVELTRPGGRALKLWATLHTLGRRGVVELLERHQRLAGLLRELIAAHPDLVPVPSGPHPVVCFRYRGLDDTQHRELVRRLQRDGRVFLGGVDTGSGTALRACVCNFRTTETDVAFLVDEVATVGRAVLSEETCYA